MTNREKYLGKILEIAVKGKELAVRNGMPTSCENIEDCQKECELCNHLHTCSYMRKKWLGEDCETEEQRPLGWIRVYDKLPENGEVVIVTEKDFGKPIIARYKDNKFKIEIGELTLDFTGFEVIAWMPAPNVYRGK